METFKAEGMIWEPGRPMIVARAELVAREEDPFLLEVQGAVTGSVARGGDYARPARHIE